MEHQLEFEKLLLDEPWLSEAETLQLLAFATFRFMFGIKIIAKTLAVEMAIANNIIRTIA
ncbi:MAG TPA: hypothetical protein VFI73_08765 [Candidatus Nitrosopolaris sp.]|nr:hypothetical protein [Candidatus Nitrosopolaris sp.]